MGFSLMDSTTAVATEPLQQHLSSLKREIWATPTEQCSSMERSTVLANAVFSNISGQVVRK